MNSKPNPRAAIALLCATALVGVGLIHWAYVSLLPWTVGSDGEAIGAQDLAEMALQSVQYVNAVTMATFGGAVLLLTQGFSNGVRDPANGKRRMAAAVGVLLLGLAILAGFVSIEAILEALEFDVVRAKTDSLRLLRVLQSSFLVAGVALVGWALLADIVRGPGAPDE